LCCNAQLGKERKEKLNNNAVPNSDYHNVNRENGVSRRLSLTILPPDLLCNADISIVYADDEAFSCTQVDTEAAFPSMADGQTSEFPRMGACGGASLLLKDPDCTEATIRAAALTGAVDIALGIYDDAAPRTAAVVAAGEVVQVRKGPRALHEA
jgi:hypothetical protein